MSVTLDEIRKQWPEANYPPDPDCEKCDGVGSWWFSKTRKFVKPHWSPCMCIFVEHSFCGTVRDGIRKMLQADAGKE